MLYVISTNLEELDCEIGCKVGKLPSSYLGLPLGASHKSMAVWDEVKEWFRKWFSLWKRQTFPKGEDSFYFVVF